MKNLLMSKETSTTATQTDNISTTTVNNYNTHNNNNIIFTTNSFIHSSTSTNTTTTTNTNNINTTTNNNNNTTNNTTTSPIPTACQDNLQSSTGILIFVVFMCHAFLIVIHIGPIANLGRPMLARQWDLYTPSRKVYEAPPPWAPPGTPLMVRWVCKQINMFISVVFIILH